MLQSRRGWSGAKLADRLGVTGRSVRRDIERLRELGYLVHASNGHSGGYRGPAFLGHASPRTPLIALVTYDGRLGHAAEALRMTVIAPGIQP